MDNTAYLAVMEKTSDGYSVYFPDLPGCVSWGNDLEEAQKMAKEALELHLYGMEKERLSFPVASKSVNVNSGDIVSLVVAYPEIFKDTYENKKVRMNVTIPNGLKNMALKENVNFSQVLELALKKMFNHSLNYKE